MTADVIIGGGVIGTAVARELALGGRECRLLEARQVGAGASAGPGRRGVRANGRDLRELPLVKEALKLWPTLHEDLGVEPLFERTGQLLLIEQDRDLPAAEARVRLQTGMGIASDLLGAAQVRDLEPAVGQQIVAAVYCPNDGVADHSATTQAYAAAAKRAGAEIEEGTPVSRLISDRDRIVALETSAGARVPVTGNVFVLANSGVSDLLADFLTLPTWNMAFQVLVSAPLDEMPVRHLVGHAHRKLALKGEAGNRLMISGGRIGRWDHARDIGLPIDDEIRANVADAIAVFPALAGMEIETANTDHLESMCIDGVPVIDRVPGIANAFFATGWCGHGWAIAPVVAKLIAAWALQGDRPNLLAPFGCYRFDLPET